MGGERSGSDSIVADLTAAREPLGLLFRSLEPLGRLLAASLLVFAISFDVDAYLLLLSWASDASGVGF